MGTYTALSLLILKIHIVKIEVRQIFLGKLGILFFIVMAGFSDHAPLILKHYNA